MIAQAIPTQRDSRVVSHQNLHFQSKNLQFPSSEPSFSTTESFLRFPPPDRQLVLIGLRNDPAGQVAFGAFAQIAVFTNCRFYKLPFFTNCHYIIGTTVLQMALSLLCFYTEMKILR